MASGHFHYRIKEQNTVLRKDPNYPRGRDPRGLVELRIGPLHLMQVVKGDQTRDLRLETTEPKSRTLS